MVRNIALIVGDNKNFVIVISDNFYKKGAVIVNRKEIKEWFFNNLLTFLSILTPILSYLFSAIAHNMGNAFSQLEILLLSVLTIQMIVILIKLLWNKKSYKSYHYPYSKITSNYEVIKKSVYYEKNDKNELTFSKNITLKSKIDNLDAIYDKFIWTGTSSISIPEAGVHVAEIKESNKIGIWKYFQIIFDSPIFKGESLTINYQWPIITNCNTSSPFFSTSTEEPTKNLELVLKLGRKYANREIILEEYHAIEGDHPISVKRVCLDQGGDYTWNIYKPKRFRYYRIRWEWSLTSTAVPTTINNN